MSGFTFNGKHSSQFSVDYIPDGAARWFHGPEFDIYKTDVAWKNGGYYYGNAVKIRKIELDCYFEEITIATREKIRNWLGRNVFGELIFDDRPFVEYYVRPSDVVSGEIYNDTGKYSGTFHVSFEAYNPFGYLTRKYNTGSETDQASDYCGLIDRSLMPDAPTVNSRSFQVYNPGTETCGMTIRIRGTTENPIMFVNHTNETSCIFESLPGNNLTLDINGDTGYCISYVGTNTSVYESAYAYHDRGIVRLEPCYTEQNINYTYTSDSGTAKVPLFYHNHKLSREVFNGIFTKRRKTGEGLSLF